MSTRIKGLDGPMPRGPRRYPVRWPVAGRLLDVTLLDDAWTPVHVHWVAGASGDKDRHFACHGTRSCPYCLTGSLIKLVGYMPAFDHAAQEYIVAAVPNGALVTVISIVPEDRSLRGVRIEMGRRKDCVYGPVSIGIVTERPAHVWRGEPPDVWPTLVSIYGPRCRPDVSGDFMREGE